MNLVLARLSSNYNPSRELTVDESMVPFRGRLGMKQYMKDKPTKWGIKQWMVAESETGYVLRAVPYTGKEADGACGTGLATRVVMSLMEEYLGKGHHLYCDNFYTSLPLATALFEQHTYLCGTIRKDRAGFPKELVLTAAEERGTDRGDCDWLANGDLLAGRWMDNKAVYTLSTIHTPYGENGKYPQTTRKLKDGTLLQLSCLPQLVDYQKYMAGVDHADQILASYSMMRKSYKWWRKLFWYYLEICVIDALIVHNQFRTQLHLKTCNHLAFRLELVQGLINGRVYRQRAPGRKVLGELPIRLQNTPLHYLEYTHSRKDCHVCNKVAKKQGKSYEEGRRRCHTVCNGQGCDGVGLCPPTATSNHFHDYHTKKYYYM